MEIFLELMQQEAISNSWNRKNSRSSSTAFRYKTL